MAVLSPLHIALILVGIVSYILYIKLLKSKYPPGPWPLPLIGNLHLLSKNPHFDLTDMVKQYGPIFTVWLGAEPNIILNELSMLKEGFVQKGVEFGGRSMDTNGFKTIFHGNEDLLSRSYDDKVDVMRTLALSIMRTRSIGGLSMQKIVKEDMKELIKLIKGMNEKVVNPFLIMHIPISNTIMRSTLNLRFGSEEDPEYMEWTEANLAMATAFEKSSLINFFPSLWYILPSWRSAVRRGVQLVDRFVDRHLRNHEDTHEEGIVRDLTDVMIEYRKNQVNVDPSKQLSRLNVLQLIKNMLGAGTITTIGSIVWAFLILLRRPDIQERIYQELHNLALRKRRRDAGTEKRDKNDDSSELLFDLVDRPNLPYLNAFIHEAMRRCTIASLSLPHKTMADTSVGGYSVPKDTVVVFNIHACHMDGSVWTEPKAVIPERFLDESGKFDFAKAKLLLPFGAGPRNCVGENLARIEIFICLANVVHTFELCCPSKDDLPGLEDGMFKQDYSPPQFEMYFKLRKE